MPCSDPNDNAATRRAPRFARCGAAIAFSLVLAACAGRDIHPTNAPLTDAVAHTGSIAATATGDVSVIVALSGGGARSAAFGYGVLSTLAEQRSPGGRNRTLADDVAAVAGVSGGGILAAYFALHGGAGLSGFRHDFLDQDVEASLRTHYTPDNLLRAYQGGVNDLSGLPAWLDARLYRGATMGDLNRGDRPRLILHATDLYNRAPFPFDRASFSAICSNYDDFSLAQAVAASAAVPIAFSPIVLRNYSDACPVDRAAPHAAAGPSLVAQHAADSVARYAHAPDLRYLKLLDGGLVDNLAALNLIRAMRGQAPEPLSIAAARRARRIIIIVADASMRVGGDVSSAIEGPTAPEAIVAAADAMIDGASRMSFDALRREASRWRARLAQWRCRDAPAARCDAPDVVVVRVALADIQSEPERSRIFGLHNKLSLGADDADFLIGLGRRLLRDNTAYRGFIGRT